MTVSISMKKRFCKDYNLPVKLFDEPYFFQRLALCEYEGINPFDLWIKFFHETSQFSNEQEYFSYYNSVKDKIIEHIKGKESYNTFNNLDFKVYNVDNKGVGENTVFRPFNNEKKLLSLDLVKGNFTAMKFFDDDLVDNKETYEEFMGQFTDHQHIIESKYIRQVIFGNCNPRRQVAIEKYIMSNFFEECIKNFGKENILSYSSDEVVVDISNQPKVFIDSVLKVMETYEKTLNVVIHKNIYTMEVIPNSEFCIQHFENGKKKLKNVPALFYPFVVKHLLKQEITEDDKVFFHEGHKAKFIDVPNFNNV